MAMNYLEMYLKHECDWFVDGSDSKELPK